MKGRLYILGILVFFISSCYDIKEEMVLNRNGSGVYQITFTLHDSVYAEMFAQDSMKMVNSIEKDLRKEKERLLGIEGIHNVNCVVMKLGKVSRVGFEFKNVSALNKALVRDSNSPRYFLTKKNWSITGGLPMLFKLDELGSDTSKQSRDLEQGIFQNSKYTADILVMGKIKSTGNKLAKKAGNRIVLNCDLNAVLDNKKTNTFQIKFK